MLNVGFIGAGSLANRMHYPSVSEVRGARIAAICDLDQARLDQTADRYDVSQRYRDYHEMLANEALDAVYVIMPPMGLPQIVIDCLRAGKHVFMEKPPGVSTDACAAMLDVAERHGLKTMVGFNRRFAYVVAESKRRVEAVGHVTQAMAEFHKN